MPEGAATTTDASAIPALTSALAYAAAGMSVMLWVRTRRPSPARWQVIRTLEIARSEPSTGRSADRSAETSSARLTVASATLPAPSSWLNSARCSAVRSSPYTARRIGAGATVGTGATVGAGATTGEAIAVGGETSGATGVGVARCGIDSNSPAATTARIRMPPPVAARASCCMDGRPAAADVDASAPAAATCWTTAAAMSGLEVASTALPTTSGRSRASSTSRSGMTSSGAARRRFSRRRPNDRDRRDLTVPGGQLERLRHLGFAQIEQVAIRQHLAVLVAQLVNGDQQRTAELIGDGAFLGRSSGGLSRALVADAHRQCGAPLRGRTRVAGLVDHDAHEPRPEARVRLEAIQRVVGLDECLLRDVFGLRRIARDQRRESDGAALMARDQLAVGVDVTAAHARNQLCVRGAVVHGPCVYTPPCAMNLSFMAGSRDVAVVSPVGAPRRRLACAT